MQPFIIPDYLDLIKQPKNVHLHTIALACALTPYMNVVNDTTVNINFKGKLPCVNGFFLHELVPLISKDESLKVFLRTYKAYKEKNSKNYLINKNLSQALFDTKLDLKVKLLPKNFTAFLDIKNLTDHDGDLIEGIFVDIYDKPEPTLFMGALCYKKELDLYCVSHLHISLSDSESLLVDVIKKYKEINSYITPEACEKIKQGESFDIPKSLYTETRSAKYHKHLHAIFNTILYIHHHPETMVEESNTFSNKKSKRLGQEKVYTQRRFIEVGKGFTLPKEYTCGEIGVIGHWRWQPYGALRAFIKHIFIAPHVRNYSKLIHNEEQQLCH